MMLPGTIDSALFKSLVRRGAITLAGNRKLSIYGTLRCSAGKRMKSVNRVFFSSPDEALKLGYRPCGHCLRNEYGLWKEGKGPIGEKYQDARSAP